MKFARAVYRVAAVWGFLSLVPLYFASQQIAQFAPPALTHREFYFGFIGLALLWQCIFLLIGSDPVRYRPLMLLSILEKTVYTVPVVILYLMGQVNSAILGPALVDPLLGAFFIAAYVRTADLSSLG